MKTVYAFFITLLLCLQNSFCQDTSCIINLSKMPVEGVLLDKGWRFHAGDNPEYANPYSDDSRWQQIDPTKDIDDIPLFAKTGIGWLRLKLSLSNDLQKEQFALL